MRCHYEVLAVPRDADDSEIKKAYRKLALKNHPDKNPDKVEEYTKIFREIQAAYDVLSDKQERAFYDKHREAILRGGDDFVDEALDLMQFFNTGAHTGYNDEPEGFFSVFDYVFKTIGSEEEPYLEGDSAEEYEVPDFGNSESDYETVVAKFYSYWMSYCTKKSYVWKDKYDIRQAPNRPTQRLMEKENKKIRESFKRKRNEEVRALVQYIRKRDPRAKAYREKMEAAKNENKQKLEQKRADDIMKRNEALNDYKEQDWMVLDGSKLDDIDAHFDDHFGTGGEQNELRSDSDENSNEDELEMIDEFYCIACEKTFKSEKALSNHEKSKKHKENVKLIKDEMEDEILNEIDLNDEQDNSSTTDEHGGPEEAIRRVDSMTLTENVIRRNVIDYISSQGEVSIPEDSILAHSTDSLEYTKQRGIGQDKIKGRKKMKKPFDETVELKLGDSPLTDSIQVHRNRKAGKLNKSDGIVFEAGSNSNDSSAGEDTNSKNKTDAVQEEQQENDSPAVKNKNGTNNSQKQKQRKGKDKEPHVDGGNNNEDDNFLCIECGYEFPSRNKLFAHVKAEGHAAFKEKSVKDKSRKSKKAASKR